ncbi:universal stress protein [Methylovirgula sp. 4M-Z18]|nr:universal stress protein [Methylovirgula sp. 4M-Z18]RFB74983.1 universal stress protein [Methylovirgula sp. 4M-Z18]
MFHHILIPTDGSPLSTEAVKKGIEFARHIGASVTLVSAIEPFNILTTNSEQLARTQDEYTRYAREEAARHLEDAGKLAKKAAVACNVVQIEHPHPYQAIIQTAQEKGCDLIAMASHGRRGVAALVIGSETAKVLTHSKIPVLVYR